MAATFTIWVCALLVLAVSLSGRDRPPSAARPTALAGELLSPVATNEISATAPATVSATIPSDTSAPPISKTVPPEATVTAIDDAVDTPQIIRRVTAAVEGLRTGSITAVVEYTGGTRSTVQVRFNRDEAGQVRALQTVTTYRAATGERTNERLVIGDRSWERRETKWVPRFNQADVLAQFRTYLPRPEVGTEVRARTVAQNVELQYYDSVRDVDVTLVVDGDSGRPYSLRERGRGSETITAVTYANWNRPIQIAPPADRDIQP